MRQAENVEIAKLKLLDDNPRKISGEAMAKLIDSLKDDPQYFENRPCLVNRCVDGTLLVYAGNQRVKAAKKLKWKTVPCIIEDGLSDDVIFSRVIKDNRHAGDWDYEILIRDWEMEDLIEMGFDMKEFGVDGDKSPDIDDVEDHDFILKVTFDDETNMKKLYDRLRKEGYNCKISK